MKYQINLPTIDLINIKTVIGTVSKDVGKLINDNKDEIFGSSLLLAVAEIFKVRHARKKDQKAFAEFFIKQQAITRKHEAQINALQKEAENIKIQSRYIDQFEQFAKKSLPEVGLNEQV